jgi:hypothetical protein
MSDDPSVKNAWVERVLGCRISAPGDAPTQEGRGAGVRLTQALMLWNQARSNIGKQVETLQKAILAASAEDEAYPDIVDGIGNIEAVLSLLDDELLEVLSAIRATQDVAEKAKLSGRARDIVKRCQAAAAADALLADIDTKNGFVTLDIKSQVTGTLAKVLEMI